MFCPICGNKLLKRNSCPDCRNSMYSNKTRINTTQAIADFFIILALIGLLFLSGQVIAVVFFDKNLLIVESYLEVKKVHQDLIYKCIIFFCESLFTTFLPFIFIFLASRSKEASYTFLIFFFIIFSIISAYQINVPKDDFMREYPLSSLPYNDEFIYTQ